MKKFEPSLYYRIIIDEKIHSMMSLLVVSFAIFLILISHNAIFQFSVFVISLIYYIYLRLSLKFFLKSVIYTFSFSIFYLFMAAVFPAEESFFYNKNLMDIFTHFDILQSKEFYNFLRVFFVSTLSVLAISILKAEVILLYLVQTFKVPVLLVYPLLFAVNAIHIFKKKYDLYLFNNKLRQIRGFVWPRLLFQFLVFIIRFSESGALSLVARGLSEEKKYYYHFSLNQKDKILGALFLVFLCMCLFIK